MGFFFVCDDATFAANERRTVAQCDLESQDNAVGSLLRADEQNRRARQRVDLSIEEIVLVVVRARDAHGDRLLLRHDGRIALW